MTVMNYSFCNDMMTPLCKTYALWLGFSWRTSLPSQQVNAMDQSLASDLRRQQQVRHSCTGGKDRRGTKERNREPERALFV